MANSPQARKRVRRSMTQRLSNVPQRSMLRTVRKKFYTLIEEKKAREAAEQFVTLQRLLDRAARKNLLPINRANRYKANAHKSLSELKD